MYIPIIYYHSIAPAKNPEWIKKYLTLELNAFEMQMKYLHNHHYQTIFLDEYFDLLNNGTGNKKKYICITFDDGFLDNWIYAYPVLKKYKFKGTIFVSPEFVDRKATIRKTLNDYWAGKASMEEIKKWGYLSWDEMAEMESSGLIDIQSHTMSHAEIFVSEKIVDFHHPGSQYLYPIGNLFPERKPYYIGDRDFEKLLPYGSPFFEFTSSVIAKKVWINPDFNEAVVQKLKNTDWHSGYDFQSLYKKIEPLYNEYIARGDLILKRETEQEYNERLTYELSDSKEIIEKKLNKTVKYLCWPNHDYNDYTHKIAKELGYKATVIVLKGSQRRPPDRFDRISIASLRQDNFSSLLKAKLKLGGYHLTFPFNYFYTFLKKDHKDYPNKL